MALDHAPEHPPREQLRAYLLGQLDAHSAAAVEEHLDGGCEACAAVVLQLERAGLNDPLVGAMAEAAAASTVPLPGGAPRPPDRQGSLVGLPLGDGGRYRPSEFIDAGGFGEVYEGWDRRLERRVAIKVSAPHDTASRS